MAPVNPSSDASEPGRAQLLLVGGLALAVVLVALALVLNTAIYTENLASRNDDAAIDRAVGFQQATADQVAALMAHADNGTGYATQRDAVENGVGELDGSLARYEGADGVGASVEFVGATEGRRLSQNTSARLDSDEGEANWTAAEDVTAARNLTLRLDRGDVTSLLFTGALNMTFDGSDDYTITFYESGGDASVRVRGPSLDESCTADGSGMVVVDVTAGTVDGEPCEALGFLGGLSGDYDIGFENGDEVDGTYELLVDGEVDDADDYSSAGGAEQEPLVYATTVSVTYRTAEVDYGTTVRVAPGEPDG